MPDKQYIKDGEGKEYYIGEDGNRYYRGVGDTEYQGDTQSTGAMLLDNASNMAPLATGVTNYFTQHADYGKIRDAKKLTPRLFAPTSSRIAPVRGTPTEVLNQAMNAVNRGPQSVESSDPGMQLIDKGRINAQKNESLERIFAMDSQMTSQDRARFDKQVKEYQQLNAMRRDANLGKMEAADRANSRADVNYLDSIRQLKGTALEDLSKGMYAENLGNYQAMRTDQQNVITSKNNQLNRLHTQLQDQNLSFADRATIQGKINTLNTELDDLLTQGTPRPSGIRSGLLSNYMPASNSLVPRRY